MMKAQEQLMVKMSENHFQEIEGLKEKITNLENQSMKTEETQKKEHTQLENKMLETTKKVGEYLKKFDDFTKYVKELNE